MIDSNILNYSCLEPLDVSRETFPELEEFRKIILKKNEEINLISKQSAINSKERHIIDSAQIIDFIDKNKSICTDIGSGSGLPGIVIAIIMKHKRSEMKFKLYEKSFHKSNFLKEVTSKFDLNVEVLQKNIFEEKNLTTDIIISRAFKPLPIIFEIAFKNFKKFKYIVLFLGKSGKEILNDAKKKWNYDYEERKNIKNNG